MDTQVSKEKIESTIAHLSRLVSFDTTSRRSNLELIEWVAAHLSERGATVTVLPSSDGVKANLFATLGESGSGGIVLSGHTDVVPASPENWESPPFELTRRGDKLHGRGTCDMKGFIACALNFADRFDARRSRTPVHIALSYDEELGCLGIPELISELGRSLPRPQLAVVGEPTGMRPIVAHKGYRAFETRLTGTPAHSMRPSDGVSAIRMATAFLTALETLDHELKEDMRLADMDPPYATINVGRIFGGNAVNITAADCTILWELRPVPGTEISAVLARLDALVAGNLPADLAGLDVGSRITTHKTGAEPVFDGHGGDAFQLVRELTGAANGYSWSGGTEAGFFQQAGISTVVFGPGDAGQAHRENEYISVDELVQGIAFLDALGNRLYARGL